MAEPVENNAPKRGTRRWVKVAFVVSLALNLVVVGLVVGVFLRMPHGAGPYGKVSMGLGTHISAFSPEQRDKFDGLVAAEIGSQRAFFKRLRQERRQVTRLVLAEPFDADAVRESLKNTRGVAVDGAEAVQEAFVSVLADMSAEEFSAYVAAVETKRKERRKRWHKKKRPRE